MTILMMRTMSNCKIVKKENKTKKKKNKKRKDKKFFLWKFEVWFKKGSKPQQSNNTRNEYLGICRSKGCCS